MNDFHKSLDQLNLDYATKEFILQDIETYIIGMIEVTELVKKEGS